LFQRERESLREKIWSERKCQLEAKKNCFSEREREREFKREDLVREKVPVRGKKTIVSAREREFKRED